MAGDCPRLSIRIYWDIKIQSVLGEKKVLDVEEES
jgi:hypothetical protein